MNNRRAIIDLLLANGSLSRVAIARKTGLSKPTVSAVISDLIAAGAAQELGLGASTGGRKPVLLRLGGEGKLIAGVEIDASVCRFILTDLGGAVVARHDQETTRPDPETVVDLLVEGIDQLFKGRDRQVLIGCGVAVPGLIDPVGEQVMWLAQDWQGVPLADLLTARLGVPVMVTDRGKAAALGELWVGRARPRGDLIYFYLGAGVGGAIIRGNALHLGANHTACELGHMTIDLNGPLCKCGNRGCLEAFASTGAIAASARAAVASGRPTLLTTKGTNAETVAAIEPAARAGDAVAREIIDETATYLGIAVANLVNVLNPAAVILGGPTAQWWGDLLVTATREVVARRAFAVPLRAVQIVLGQAEEVAVPLGAAVQVRERAGELLAIR